MSLQIDQLRTLKFRIATSLESSMFRTVYATDSGGNVVDVTKGGQLSCAVYVSALLVMSGFLPKMCATVASLEKLLQRRGWVAVSSPVIGAVVIWHAAERADGKVHEHAGFVYGHHTAVSHSDTARCPVEHQLLSSGMRSVRTYYVHPELMPSTKEG